MSLPDFDVDIELSRAICERDYHRGLVRYWEAHVESLIDCQREQREREAFDLLTEYDDVVVPVSSSQGLLPWDIPLPPRDDDPVVTEAVADDHPDTDDDVGVV